MAMNPNPDEMRLVNEFVVKVLPWCKENELSLRQAFTLSNGTYPKKYKVLNALWSTEYGRAYLRGLFLKMKKQAQRENARSACKPEKSEDISI